MPTLEKKRFAKLRRHLRIRKKVYGTTEKPRLSVYRSLNNLFVQLVDDVNQKTLFAFSTQDKEFKKICKNSGNVEAAHKLGEHYGAVMTAKGFKKIAFDRGGYLYHGRIKSLADSLRKTGVQF